MLDEIFPRYSGMSVNCQHPCDDIFDICSQIRLEFKFMIFDIVVQIFNIGSRPWSFSMKHLIKYNAHTPNIATVTKLLASQYLRGCVQRCAKA